MGRITAERKRELENELKEMANRLKEIVDEVQESIWINGTYYQSDEKAGVYIDRFFNGKAEPALIERRPETIKGMLSVRANRIEEVKI